jgi:hypothetical protein
MSWRRFWALACPRCSARAVSHLVTGFALRIKGIRLAGAHCLSLDERQRFLLTCNEPEFAALPPRQIVHVLAGRVLFSVWNAVFPESRTATLRFTGEVPYGNYMNQDPCHSSGLLVQARFAAGISPT